jgi:hypothetical protein
MSVLLAVLLVGAAALSVTWRLGGLDTLVTPDDGHILAKGVSQSCARGRPQRAERGAPLLSPRRSKKRLATKTR